MTGERKPASLIALGASPDPGLEPASPAIGDRLDDAVRSIAYTEGPGVAETPDVSFTYDPAHKRLATMVDGTGTTSYAYHPVESPPTLGAGKLAAIDGPLPNDTIAYGYDELGRVVTRSINGAANEQTTTYDFLGRPATVTNLLGTFTYGYDPATRRLVSLAYPNGQTTTYAYHDLADDFRLREIHNRRPGGTTLSRFEYTYDLAANVKTWLQQADSDPPTIYELGYDSTNQLTAAILKSTDPTPQILKRYYYAYDAAGNRSVEQIDDSATVSLYNNMNQITSQGPGGLLVFAGSVDEPAIVTVGGTPAGAAADNSFRGGAQVSSGTTQVQVQARDFAQPPNVRSNTYEVTQAGSTRTFTFDANGNMTSDGTRTFEWNAENRLVAVTTGTIRTEFGYDGLGRRVTRTKNDGEALLSEGRLLRCGYVQCEERDGTGQGVSTSLFDRGSSANGFVAFLSIDLLGSVRDETSQTGGLLGRWTYSPFGRSFRLVGTSAERAGYGGNEPIEDSGLVATHFRLYDADLGRWLTEDSIEPSSGSNLYAYARNNPTTLVDIDGAAPTPGDVARVLGKFCKKAWHMLHRVHRIDTAWECGKERLDCDEGVDRECDCKFRSGGGFGLGSPAQQKLRCKIEGNDCCDLNLFKCAIRHESLSIIDIPGMPCFVGRSRCDQ